MSIVIKYWLKFSCKTAYEFLHSQERVGVEKNSKDGLLPFPETLRITSVREINPDRKTTNNICDYSFSTYTIFLEKLIILYDYFNHDF